jgi:hypothetical protein
MYLIGMLQEKSKAKPPDVYCQVANIPIAAANIVTAAAQPTI